MSLTERLGPGVGGPIARLRESIHSRLNEIASTALPNSEDVLRAEVYSVIDALVTELNAPLSGQTVAGLVQEIIDERLGHGVLEPLLRDDSVTEIMVTRFDEIYVERKGQLSLTEVVFQSEGQLRKTIERMVGHVGRRVDETNPMVDARLANGSRINVVLPPIALNGAVLTVRKFGRERLDFAALQSAGTMSQSQAEYLARSIAERKNIVVSGGTGSGKSTTLNALCEFIDAGERVITIEDSAELQVSHKHLVRLESRPQNSEGVGRVSIRDLVRNALRMRPDRIIVGEVRDEAAIDMLQAMNTGHDGSLTTVHANSPLDALRRIETMCLMSNLDLPLAAVRSQIWSAVDVVVHQVRGSDGIRRITKIVEVADSKNGDYRLTEVGN